MKLESRRAHRRIWFVLTILLPVIVIAALAIKQQEPELTEPVLLEAPEAG